MLNIYESKRDIKEKYIYHAKFTLFIRKNHFSGFLSKAISLKVFFWIWEQKDEDISSELRKRKKKEL